MMNQIKTPDEIRHLRESGGILAEVLRRLSAALEPGQTTGFLGDMAARELAALGGKPAFLGYHEDRHTPPFPSTICISVNDEVVHGIPGSRVIEAGDLVGLDFGVTVGGMITDGAVTVVAGGKPTPAQERLLTATKQALDRGIAQVHGGARTGDISAAIEKRLRADNLGVIEELSGHGVGHRVHEDPLILNYGTAGTGARLKTGMSIAIEPMATLGGRDIFVDQDGWTILTSDGSLSAQFEHTVLITDEGCEVLTK
ncbi:MAG TPA: type I methionyl aminopeptidase [Candidatus Saccharimonadia bacterium]|jgi:methionyl aminopeptidase|nr:type I methionyl aminopeptidase [Candidatus Saccharimonadia bacterium]